MSKPTTTPAVYRSKRRKYIEIPVAGGEPDIFLIRSMTAPLLAKFIAIFEVPIGSVTSEMIDEVTMKAKETMTADKYMQIINLTLPECVLEPKVVPGPGDENTLGIDEISETGTLLEEIFKLSGLSEEAVKQRESFRLK